MLLHSENVLQTSFMFSHTETRIIYQNNVYKVDSSNEAADAATHFEKHCKFLRTPSRLYQNKILKENIRLPAFIKPYKRGSARLPRHRAAQRQAAPKLS